MSHPPLRAVFFDYGNVCMTFSFQLFLREFEKTTGVPTPQSEEILFKKSEDDGEYAPLFRDFEIGILSPTEFFHLFTQFLNCAEKIDYETFATQWCGIFIRENHELHALLDEVSLPLYLLSNTNKIVYARHMAENAIVRKYFPRLEQQIFSYRERTMKPERGIYEIALARAGVRPDEAFFVDDRPENILGWRMLGGRGVVYDAQTDPIDHLRTNFRELGIIE